VPAVDEEKSQISYQCLRQARVQKEMLSQQHDQAEILQGHSDRHKVRT
jgi:hypothetical protein